MQTCAAALIEQLAHQGVRHLYTVPGESFIAALDALHDRPDIHPVTFRHEGTATMAAEASARLSQTLGVAIVSRGPGAANALAGVYSAKENASPLLLIVATAQSAQSADRPFQHIDVEGVFSGVAKWCATVPDADAACQYVARAGRIARHGRPGPVVLAISEDILNQKCAASPVSAPEPEDRAPSGKALADIHTALAHAERPIIIAGGPIWSEKANADLATFAKRFDLPVVTAFRRQDAFDNTHPCYAGHAGLSKSDTLLRGLRAADVIIAIGGEPDAVTSNGYVLFRGVADDQMLFVISDAVSPADTAYPDGRLIDASPMATLERLAAMPLPGKTPPWGIWRRDLNAAFRAHATARPTPGAVKLESVISDLSRILPDDAIVTNGAGNYAAFLHRYFHFRNFPSALAPQSGSMGYGLPAAIAAKLTFPDRAVVALAGDGCFQMAAADFATAVQYALPIIVIVANNGSLGTIRMHQERRFPHRVVATSLINPDFVDLAKSMGGSGERVESTEQFEPALRRALANHQPSLIELATDIEAITPDMTLSEVRSATIET